MRGPFRHRGSDLRLLALSLSALACACTSSGQDAPWLTAPTPTSHDRYFPIESGPHQLSCNTCHGASDSFKDPDCTSCHTEAPTQLLHPAAAAPGYAWASPQCIACHPRGTGQLTPAGHARFFPIDSGQTHALGANAVHQPGPIACQSCHTSGDRAQADCTACHTEAAMTAGGRPFHAAVPDLAPGFAPGPQQTARCLLCHAGGVVPVSVSFSTKAPAHDARYAFRLAAGAPHAGDACLGCHSITKPIGDTRLITADFATQTCTTCHAPAGSLAQDLGALHTGLGTYQGTVFQPLSTPPVPDDSKHCLLCHSDGSAGGFDHSKGFPIGSGDTHALGKRFALAGQPAPVTLACATCHQDAAARGNVTCTTCHTAAGTNSAGPGPVDLGPAHAAQLAGTSWRAGAPGAPAGQCLACHAGDLLERTAVHGRGTAAFTSDAPGVTFRIDHQSPNHFVACEQCHTALLPADPALQQPRIDFAQRSCGACHTEAKEKLVTVHRGLGISLQDPAGPSGAAACLKCHPDGGPAPLSQAITHAFFPIDAAGKHALGAPAVHRAGAIGCASCHTALTTDPSRIDCTGCHTAAAMTNAGGAGAHDLVPDLPRPLVPGEATSLSFCLQCHADGKVPAALSWSASKAKTHDALTGFVVSSGAHATTNLAPAQGCFACHAVRRAIPGVTIPNGGTLTTTDFKQQTCTSCHAPAGALAQDVDARHRGLGTVTIGGLGFTYQNLSNPPAPADSKACLGCHADGSSPDFDHSAFFPIAGPDRHALHASFPLAGAAAPVVMACGTCHQDPARDRVTCTVCHTAAGSNGAGPMAIDLGPAHGSLLAGTNWQAGTAPTVQCLLCHAGDLLERVAVHGRGTAAFPASVASAPTFAIDGSSANHFAACEQCHTAQVAGGAVLKNPRTDFAQRSCNACHTEAKEKLVTLHAAIGVAVQDPTGPDNAPACLACHPGGGPAPASQSFSHPFFPVDAASPHALSADAVHLPGKISCRSCHTALATDSSRVDCTGCHTAAAMTSASGARAHDLVPDLPKPFTPGVQTSLGACLQCHADGRVPASLAWSTAKVGTHDALFKFQVSAGSTHATGNTNPTEACATCHAVQKPIAGVTLPSGAMTTIDFTRQTCTACHASAGQLSQDIDLLHAGLGPTTIGGLVFNYQSLSIPPVPADSKGCLNCHADGAVHGFDHGKWFPVGAADTHALGKTFALAGSATPVVLACATCHTNPAVRQEVTCTACHTSAGGNGAGPKPIDLAPAHAALLAGSNWKAAGGPTPQCLLCHAGDLLERDAVHGRGTATFPASVANAPTFAIDAGSANHFVACEQCHAAQVTADPALKNPRTDFAQRSCSACHSEAKEKLVSTHAAIGVAILDPSGPNNAAACLACHPTGGPAPSSQAYTHPFFPVDAASRHALGAPAVHAAGNLSCQSCHTALATDVSRVDCTGCHTAASMTSGGAGAHDLVSDVPKPITPGVQTSLGLCLQCHADGRVPASLRYSTAKVGTHDSLFQFQVSAGSTHATTNANPAEACATCHSVLKPIAGVTLPSGALTTIDFTQQTCTACHAPAGALLQDLDARHLGLGPITIGSKVFTYQNLSNPPVAADSKVCLNCHVDGAVHGFDHSSWFPISAADRHALGASFPLAGVATPLTLACATCHQDPAVRKNVTCISCHTALGSNAAGPKAIDLTPAHLTQLAGSNWHAAAAPTPQCLLCHAGDLLERDAVHGQGTAAFPADAPVATTFVIDGSSATHHVACEKCHVADVAGDPVLKNPRTDFAQRTCDACHSEAQDKLVTLHGLIGVTPTVGDTVDASGKPVVGHAKVCLGCHADGNAAPLSQPFTHSWFPIGTGSVHALGAAAVHAPGVFQCTTCHTRLGTDPAQIDCTACHTQAQMSTGGVSWHAAVQDLTWPGTPAPQATSLACLRCHADAQVPAQVAFSIASRKGRHDASNAAIRFTITAGATHDAAGSQPMACLTCHPATTTPDPGVPAFAVTDFTQQACTACHFSTGTLQQDLPGLHLGVTTPAPGFVQPPFPMTAAYSQTCLVCHAGGQIDPVIAAQNHTGFFPISSADSHAYGKSVTVLSKAAAISCAACHVDSSNRKNVDCTACHVQTGSNGPPGPAVPADQSQAHAGLVATVDASGATHNLWLGTGPVGTGSGESASCLRCHAADGQGTGFTALHGGAAAATGNAVFPIATGSNHFVSCDACHTAAVLGGSRQNPQLDFTRASCDQCHAPASTLSDHAGFGTPINSPYVSGDANNFAACQQCHPTGQTATNFSHLWFPITAAAVHNSKVAKCSDCHLPGSYSGTPIDNLPLITCSKCHDDSAANLPNQRNYTITQVHQAARVQISAGVAGRDIWDITGGLSYASAATNLNPLCLKCHAGNIGGAVAPWSTPLVFRLGQHDTHCSLNGKNLLSGDNTHNVNRNSDSITTPTVIPPVNICFACHDALATSSATPWATDWSVGGTSGTNVSCKHCHEHSGGAPTITCK